MSGQPRSRARARRQSPRPRAGFTLLELLAALAVVAILAGLVLTAGRRSLESGKIARARAELAVLAAALENYRAQLGDFPRVAADGGGADPASGRELYAALHGRRGPLAGAAPLVPSRRALGDFSRLTPAVASGAGDITPNAWLDPWGRPYHYAYREPAAGWTNSGFVLYSSGPDGRDDPALLPGGFSALARPENADNVYAPTASR